MTKAERRKRARARQRERERVGAAEASAVPAPAPAVEAAPSSPPVPARAAEAVAEAAADESPFITGPIAPVTQRRAAPHIEAPTPAARQELIDSPIDGDFDDGDEDDDEDEDGTQGDPHDDGDDEDEDEDDDEDDGEDEGEDDGDIEDALFNSACGAVEQGDKLTWNELIASLCSAEVEDPRLGLLVALLVQQDDKGQPLPLTGARVIDVLEDLELDDIVEEAREVAAAAEGESESPEEKAVVRTNARELREQAERELAGKPKPRDERKPVKASQLRKPQTSLGGAVPAPSGRNAR